jgi:DNA-binding NarL/FixJ family response regulator
VNTKPKPMPTRPTRRSAHNRPQPDITTESIAIFGESKGSADHRHKGEEIAPQPAHIAMSIVSNSQVVHEGLLNLLSSYSDLYLVGNYPGRFPGALEAQMLPNPPVHVVLVDGGMDHGEVAAWTSYWRSTTPPAYVVVIEIEIANDIDALLSFIESGAGGYVPKGAPLIEIVAVIRLVVQGLVECSPEVAAQLFARLAVHGSVAAQPLAAPSSLVSALPIVPIVPLVPIVIPTPLASMPVAPTLLVLPLTPRQQEVLGYISIDLTNQEIANVLVIRVNTVKRHVHNILESLEELEHNDRRYTRKDAARFAIKHGWIAIPSLIHPPPPQG